MPTDLTTYAVIQLGGLIHYIGCIHSPDSDRLVSNLSSYIRAGNEQLRLPNSYFVFLASCPTRISGELCKIADEDMEAASCKVSPATTDTPTSALYHSPDGNSQCLVGYATLSGLLAVAVALLILLTFFYCRHRRRNAGKLSEDRKSVSQASTCSRYSSSTHYSCYYIIQIHCLLFVLYTARLRTLIYERLAAAVC